MSSRDLLVTKRKRVREEQISLELIPSSWEMRNTRNPKLDSNSCCLSCSLSCEQTEAQSSMGLSVVLAPSKHVSHANESIKVNNVKMEE